jgi:hypothetical protein
MPIRLDDRKLLIGCNRPKAIVQADSSSMTALGWKADTRPGRILTLTNTGRSLRPKQPDLDRSLRSETDLGFFGIDIFH